jgi:hypothetical protein
MEHLRSHFETTASAFCGVKTEQSVIKSYRNLSHHTDLCELVTALLIRGNQMGEISNLDWLIGWVKHSTWADFWYLILCIGFHELGLLQNIVTSVSILVSCLCMLYHNFIAYFPVISHRQILISGIYVHNCSYTDTACPMLAVSSF